MPLRKVTIKNTEWTTDVDSGADVLHVRDPHAMVMAAGYLKYRFAYNESEGIYFRGQRKLYGALSPTLFRGVKLQNAIDKRIGLLKSTVAGFRSRCSILNSFGDWSHEPLLQHYGISTTWIDLVDNVWVALWFACHQAISAGKNGEFLHFEKRQKQTDADYAYILLVGADISKRNKKKPGYYSGDNTELVDLRMAAPSIFLRPHAQHGLLFRKKGTGSGRAGDYADQIRGILRIDLNDALSWLGVGKMVGTHSLFPPPYYDEGYKILIINNNSSDDGIGTIHHVGA